MAHRFDGSEAAAFGNSRERPASRAFQLLLREAHALGHKPLSGSDTRRLPKASLERASAHSAFVGQACNRMPLVEIPAHPVEQAAQACSLLFDGDRPLDELRLPALAMRRHDETSRNAVPGAINLPHGKMTATKMQECPAETLFVVYCAGPHCNGTDKAALRLGKLGRKVKVMIGGMTGWSDEGFSFAGGALPGSVLEAAE
jgi:rhodanese-related sulfurtransferase